MQFFINHFNKRYFFHRPHAWFLALLLSPIHLAEMRYKKKYHLNYVHAKKLFIFDLTLIISIFVLIAAAVSWFLYDPTAVRWVDLIIQSSTPAERMKSGEQISYFIKYANRGKTKLINPTLALRLPDTFLIESANPGELFDQNTKTFALPDLAPGGSGSASLAGLFYGNVNQEYHVLATLSYEQEKRKIREQKLASVIAVLRDSVLEINLNAPPAILDRGAAPIIITLKNNGDRPIANIKLLLNQSKNFSFVGNVQPEKGRLENNIWKIDELASREEARFETTVTARADENIGQASLVLAPVINVQNQDLTQKSATRNFQIIRPKAELNAVWANNLVQVKPGDTAELAISIKNNGAAELNNLILELPLPTEIIDAGRLANLNAGKYSSGIFTLTSAFAANLKNLKSGGATFLTINIPIRSQILTGNDIALSLEPKIIAELPQIVGEKYEISAASPGLKIGTNILPVAESRYYTVEGDQLGRGPLPPLVGEETKYWAIIYLRNTTSKVTNLKLSASLPGHIAWTGRSSVTHGAEPFFNPANRSITWNGSYLNPNETAGIYFELSFTPVAGQIGQTPLLLTNIRFSGTDSFTGFVIDKTIPDLDVSLPKDAIGRQKGVIVR